MKTTHIKGFTLGSHFVRGWWAVNGFPKIEKYVVIEVDEAYEGQVQSGVDWLFKNGAKMVNILPYRAIS